jgi:uroporphyrinogen-III synthase
VTRDDSADPTLSHSLRDLGARVLTWPTIRAAPPADDTALRSALERISEFDWLVLTSPRAVEAVAVRRGMLPPALRLAAVGGGTARRAQERGWRVDLVPAVQTAEALVAALGEAGVGAGTRVLFPSSEIARETLESGLAALGAEVVRVTAYRTLGAALDGAACARALDAAEVQVVTLASPSAVENLRSVVGEPLFRRLADDVVFAAIGPTTAEAARAAGARQLIVARDHSLEGLARCVAEWARENVNRGAS